MRWFAEARFGLFVHFGLYSMLGRGEWAMNKEAIAPADYARLADEFNPKSFDADALCALAKEAGMRYIVFTTMHHEGFRLYHSDLTDFCSTKTRAKRDFTAEVVAAARRSGLKIGLYHSLNNWRDQPDGVAALESEADRRVFIDNTFARIKELVTRYNPVDTLWYDGWWPFNADGWEAERMNAMVSAIQPHILFNGRNGLPGDFGTPEGHMAAPSPWRPWEACMTLNDNWGFHRGDNNWKSAKDVIKMLATAAKGKGNLLLNIGPRGDGSVPEPSAQVLKTLGAWMKTNAEAIHDTDLFSFDLQTRGDHRGDWSHHGPYTVSGDNLYLLATSWMGQKLVIAGLECGVKRVSILGSSNDYPFTLRGDVLTVTALPDDAPDKTCPVIKIECDAPPALYRTGGMRNPNAPHPHYDPCPSDIAH